jgi:hypothetical protein
VAGIAQVAAGGIHHEQTVSVPILSAIRQGGKWLLA